MPDSGDLRSERAANGRERPGGAPATASATSASSLDVQLEDEPPNRAWLAPLLWGTAVLGLATVLVLPVHYPSLVRTYASIQCAEEWVLERGVDGQLNASLFNHRSGASEGYRASSFDRNNSILFILHPDMVPGHAVHRGDTVGIISSTELQERLTALNGQLAAAQGQFEVSASGEKEIVVHAAEQRVAFARRKLSEQVRAFTRTSALYQQGLLSVGAYESAENALHDARDEVAMANAALEMQQTGAKPEQLDLARRNIAALQAEIAALKLRAATHTITCPIQGRVARSGSSTVLLNVVDTSRYVVSIPVPLKDLARVTSTPGARVTLLGLAAPVHGTIVSIDKEVSTVGMERVVKATAVLDPTTISMVVGLDVRCDVTCQPVTAMDLVRQFLSSLVS